MGKTYFEQIPVETVARLLEEQAGRTVRVAPPIQKPNHGLAVVIQKADTSRQPGHGMESTMKKKWQVLCEKAIDEQDPDNFIELIEELNRALGEEDRHASRQTQKS